MCSDDGCPVAGDYMFKIGLAFWGAGGCRV